MKKNSVYIILVVVVVAVIGIYLAAKHQRATQTAQIVMHANSMHGNQNKITGAMQKGQHPNMMKSVKGTKLANNTFLSPHAYLVYPVAGDLPKDTQAALNGWKVETTANSDGTEQVKLVPTESEQEDKAQTLTVKSGEKLYFVELNLKDDQNGQDKFLMDDIGILVDQNGIILNDLPTPPAGQHPPQ